MTNTIIISNSNEVVDSETNKPVNVYSNKLYFRVMDSQIGDYKAFGYNCKSIVELLEEYWDYKSYDVEYDSIDYYKSLSIERQLIMLLEDEFDIEYSEEEFIEE
jgi:ABC-type uncharacterized transport system involved in gliding motility auxiliary subunit